MAELSEVLLSGSVKFLSMVHFNTVLNFSLCVLCYVSRCSWPD